MTARERLAEELRLLAELDRFTPCQGRRRHRWTSDLPDERAWAAATCRGACPLLTECAATADDVDERFGVWGGTDRTSTRRPPSPTTSREREADAQPLPS